MNRRFLRFYLLLFILFTKRSLQATDITAQEPQQKSIHAWLEKTKTKISKKVFANGLTAIHYPIPGSNNVYVGVTYHAGGKNEGPTEHGLAHMVEHMIFKGTDKMSERDLDAIAEKFCIGGLGQGFNASTSYDVTKYYFQTDKNNWPVFVAMLADCMENVSFKEHHFASEVKAVAQEIKMRNASPFLRIFDSLGQEILPLNNPYSHSLGGDLETLLGAHADDLKKFYQRHYAPANALVTVTGDCDAEEVFKQIEEQFGHIKNTHFKQSDQPAVNPVHTDFFQKNILYHKPIPNPFACYCWVTPGSSHTSEMAGNAISYALSLRFEEKFKTLKTLFIQLVQMSLISTMLVIF
ncbi:insulinase family protein [bacterium]|nr:MAG: insulinase family protein [bacterium]